MRRILLSVISVLAALVLLVGYNVTPANSSPPPGWLYHPAGVPLDLRVNGCWLKYTHVQYGNVAVARIDIYDGCSNFVGVRVYAWGDTSTFCTWAGEVAHDYSDCTIGLSPNFVPWIQVVAVGSLIGGVERFDWTGGLGQVPPAVDLSLCICP